MVFRLLVLMALAVHAVLAIGDWALLTWISRRGRRLLARVVLVALLVGGVVACASHHTFIESMFWHATAVLTLAGFALWSKRRWAAAAAWALALLVAAVGIDAVLIEPTSFVVERYELTSKRIDQPFRIVFLADIQTDRPGPYERRVLETVAALEPDLILFGGDYVQTHGRGGWGQYEALNRLMRELFGRVDCPAAAVRGNVDDDGWRTVFSGTPVLVMGTTRLLQFGPVDVTCLDRSRSFAPDVVVDRPFSERFHVVVGHCPSYALGEVDADLLLAGHTHGGQVQLPGFGALVTLSPGLPRSWASGQTELAGGGHLIVSRGIGMERGAAPRVRLFCRPEISVIDIVPLDQPK